MQELRKVWALQKEEPVDYSINPSCQDLLKSYKKTSEKVKALANIYHQSYPDFITPDDEAFMQHPSYLALYHPIKHWFFVQCGGYVELWMLMLAAAKEWFPDKDNSKLGHTFYVRFAIEDYTWWNDRTKFRTVLKDFIRWRVDRETMT